VFEDALLAERVATRFAMEHPSENARRKYLKEHPGADPSMHTVNKDSPKQKKNNPDVDMSDVNPLDSNYDDIKRLREKRERATRSASDSVKSYKAIGDLDKELENASGASVRPAMAKAKKFLSKFKSQVEGRISELEKDKDTDPSYGTMISRSKKLLDSMSKADSVPEVQRALGEAKKWMEHNGLHK